MSVATDRYQFIVRLDSWLSSACLIYLCIWVSTIYVFLYLSIRVYVYIYICVYVFICVYVYLYLPMCLCVYICLYICPCTYLCVRVSICVYVCIHLSISSIIPVSSITYLCICHQYLSF